MRRTLRFTIGSILKLAETSPLLVFGAHPDDIEFGCGAIIAHETRLGRKAHFVVCSLGEAGTNGTPKQRTAESEESAALLGATIEFVQLDGDSHLEIRAAHAIKLAEIIRRIRPATVLAPSLVENQHPDHARLGKLVRDAARLARYGGLKELLEQQLHTIEQLFFYAITPEAEPQDVTPILIDISLPQIVTAWTAAMNAHATQASSRNYVELQLTRARLLGARAGVEYAIALYPNDPLVFESLAQAGRGARRF
jgi:N-acetylglucosamine malate deacetylase 1